MPLVTKDGFQHLPEAAYITAEQLSETDEPWLAVEVAGDVDVFTLVPHFEKITLIAVTFPSFADGRGFSVARHLRRLGYDGELRARGHVIADQYAHALACGFDGVEIDDALAGRQPFEQWQNAESKVLPPYRAKMAG
jgi:uncharacterized protein (DUF934 family)